MEEPIYVCKDTELVRKPKNPNKALYIIKVSLWIIMLVIIVMSLIFKENIMSSFTWQTDVLLIVTLVVVSYVSDEEVRVPSAIEIRFYKDYFEVYRDARYYSYTVTRREAINSTIVIFQKLSIGYLLKKLIYLVGEILNGLIIERMVLYQKSQLIIER